MKRKITVVIMVFFTIIISNLPPVNDGIILIERYFHYYTYSSRYDLKYGFEETGTYTTVYAFPTTIIDSTYKVKYPKKDTLLYRHFKINPLFFWHWYEYVYGSRYKMPYVDKKEVLKFSSQTEIVLNKD